MELGDLVSRNTSPTVTLTDAQAELLMLLKKLVCLMEADAMTDMQNVPEFRATIRHLCDKAPEAARTFATMIQEFSDGDDSQQKPATLEKSDGQPVKRKSAPGKDLSYRPPKSAKVKAAETGSLATSDQPEDGDKVHIECPAQQDHVSDGAQSSNLNEEDITAQDDNVELQAGKSSDGVEASRDKASWLLDQDHSIAQDVSVLEQEKTADGGDTMEAAVDQEMKGEVEDAGAASASNEAAEQRPKVSLESTTHPEPPRPVPANIAPVTPMKQMGDALPSPQTEEIRREKIPTSLESISSSPRSTTGSTSEPTSLMDMILEAVRVIHQFSQYPHGVPREVHSRILQTLQKDHQEAIGTPNLNQWSDGSMWMRVLEMGSSENQKITILNMLEYMGAWEWYSRQIELSQATIRTKKNKPVDHRGAAIHVLNRMQDLRMDTEQQPGKWISGVGRVAFGQEGDESGLAADSIDVSIAERARQLQRKRISMQLSRGQKLSTKLVKELGLGILFSSKIWEYTKKKVEQLDLMISDVQADQKRMRLLHILGRQLELMINEGHPDLHALYDSLKEEKLVSEEEFRELRLTYALDAEAMPKGTLNTAVDRLIKDVSIRVLGKRKLEDDDNVAVNNGTELPCNMFHRLRQEECPL